MTADFRLSSVLSEFLFDCKLFFLLTLTMCHHIQEQISVRSTRVHQLRRVHFRMLRNTELEAIVHVERDLTNPQNQMQLRNLYVASALGKTRININRIFSKKSFNRNNSGITKQKARTKFELNTWLLVKETCPWMSLTFLFEETFKWDCCSLCISWIFLTRL